MDTKGHRTGGSWSPSLPSRFTEGKIGAPVPAALFLAPPRALWLSARFLETNPGSSNPGRCFSVFQVAHLYNECIVRKAQVG